MRRRWISSTRGDRQDIIELLLEKPERALTIGIHGDRGAGKSSNLEMIENGLDLEKDVLYI